MVDCCSRSVLASRERNSGHKMLAQKIAELDRTVGSHASAHDALGLHGSIPRVPLGFSSQSREVEAQHFVAFATPAPNSALPSDSRSGNGRIATDLHVASA